MSLETIQRAITRLEQLRADSTQGEWEAFQDSKEWLVTGDNGMEAIINWGNHGKGADAELIVALHRTIPALLAILREAEEVYEYDETPYPWDMPSAVTLARAILGETE